MSFIRIFPFEEVTDFDPANLGQGDPARCQAVDEWDAREFFLNIQEIAGFEECPLYLVSPEDPNALVNGIRVVVRSGRSFLIADDPEDPEESFVNLVKRSSRGEVTFMPFSRYLKSRTGGKRAKRNTEALPPG